MDDKVINQPWRLGDTFVHQLGMSCLLIECGPINPDESICVASLWSSGLEDEEETREIGHRIISCVTAMSGIKYPDVFVNTFNEQKTEIRSLQNTIVALKNQIANIPFSL